MTTATTATSTPTAPGTTDVAGLVARRVPGFSLDAPFYTSQEVYEADLAAVWARSWIFVATEAEIREPGDFVTVDIGPHSVIVVRDDDEQVSALRNVCRHRGSRVLTERSGSVGNIVCGYHRWTYATDGTLLHAGDQAPTFDRSCFGLRRVHVRTVSGLIFVSLADTPPQDWEEMAATVAPYLDPHQPLRTKVAAQHDLVEHANWKLVMENNRECYHCEGGHPELTCTFFPTWGYDRDKIPARLMPAHERYLAAEAALEAACLERGMAYAEVEALEEERATGFRVQREALDGAGESYTVDGAVASRRLLGDFDTARLGRASVHTQPNAWFHFLSDHVVTFAVLPLGPDRTLVRTTWLVHEDAVEGEDYDLERLTEVWDHTNEEDGEFCARAQQGVGDPAYVPGPYSPSERQVESFVAWYVARLREELAR